MVHRLAVCQLAFVNAKELVERLRKPCNCGHGGSCGCLVEFAEMAADRIEAACNERCSGDPCECCDFVLGELDGDE